MKQKKIDYWVLVFRLIANAIATATVVYIAIHFIVKFW
jgi:hypothetical protein